MDRSQSGQQGKAHIEILTYGSDSSSCDKCGNTADVQKFDGSWLCGSCRNQYAAMSL